MKTNWLIGDYIVFAFTNLDCEIYSKFVSKCITETWYVIVCQWLISKANLLKRNSDNGTRIQKKHAHGKRNGPLKNKSLRKVLKWRQRTNSKQKSVIKTAPPKWRREKKNKSQLFCIKQLHNGKQHAMEQSKAHSAYGVGCIDNSPLKRINSIGISLTLTSPKYLQMAKKG